MKKITLIIIFINLIGINFTFSQNYKTVDSIVDSYPKDVVNTNQLVQLINKDFSVQDQKVRAVYRWITTNISYDADFLNKMNDKPMNAFSYKTEKEKELKEKIFKLELVSNAMTSKKTICHGYAALVENLCRNLGIETHIILGNLKSSPLQIGELPSAINHAWNAVKINGKWQFVDTTLGAGFVSGKTNLFKFYFNDGFCFTTPERFFLNHYPLDEKWLLIAKNKNDYAQLPLHFGNYFQKNYQLIKPESGLCKIAENENFIFSIKGLNPNDTVEYSTSIDNKIIYLEQENNQLDYTISLIGKNNSFVSIYVNGKIIATYKIL